MFFQSMIFRTSQGWDMLVPWRVDSTLGSAVMKLTLEELKRFKAETFTAAVVIEPVIVGKPSSQPVCFMGCWKFWILGNFDGICAVANSFSNSLFYNYIGMQWKERQFFRFFFLDAMTARKSCIIVTSLRSILFICALKTDASPFNSIFLAGALAEVPARVQCYACRELRLFWLVSWTLTSGF